MGKATIISSQGDGLYRVVPVIDTSRADAEIITATATVAEIDARLPDLQQDIDDAEFDMVYAQDVFQAKIFAYGTDKSEANRQALEAAQKTARETEAIYLSAVETKKLSELRKVSLQKRIELLTSMEPDTSERDAWCADYNEEIEGEVGTIEVGRESLPGIIRPAGSGGTAAAYNLTDGSRQPILSSTPAAAFWNYAMLSGMNKWLPRYRVGAITALDSVANTADISLDTVTSTGQALDINQAPVLFDVPVVYLACHAAAFRVGDRVIIDFPTSDWTVPRVIGFESHPQTCAFTLILHDGLDLYGYSRHTDKLTAPYSMAGSGEINTMFNGRSVLADGHYADTLAAWTDDHLPSGLTPAEFLAALEYSGGVNLFEMALFASYGNDVYGSVADKFGQIATIPDTLLPQYAAAFGPTFGFPAYKPAATWNLYRGIILYALNVANRQIHDSWYWTPSFFTVQPGDGYGLKPGWYYGQYPNPDYDFDNALTSLKVSFKGIVDSRYTGGPYTYGWCEMVAEVEGVAKGDLSFYFQATYLTVPGNPHFYRELVTGEYSKSMITIGADLPGFSRTLQITTDLGAPDVKMWSFAAWTSGDDPAGAVGIAIISGTGAEFYRFKGYNLQIYVTDTYHSHNVSRDGTILAVFESDGGGIIHRAKIFDLFGVMIDGEYTSGGYTELRSSAVVADAVATTGCLIPRRADGFDPAILGYDLSTAGKIPWTGSDYTDYLSSLSTMAFRKDAGAGLVIQKVVCSDGVNAEFGISQDPCFTSIVKVDDPDEGIPEEKLVSWWDQGGVWRGLVRGEFSGDHPDMRFYGDGTGGSGWYGIITLPETFSIIANQDGTLGFEGYTGDLTVGNCITTNEDGAYIPDPDCADECSEGTYTVTAASSCGQTASREIGYDAPAPLSVSANEDIQVGDFVGASGGVEPYTFSFGGGTIDADTGEILTITACGAPGDVRTTTVGASDACGQSDYMVVRLPGGRWYYNDDAVWCREDQYFPYNATDVECVSGGTKTRYLLSSICWDEEDYDDNAASAECTGCGVTACSPLVCGIQAGCNPGKLIFYQHWLTDSFYWGCFGL